MIKMSLFCPFCSENLIAVTSSGEEFTCRECDAMVDVLDADLSMVSRAPNHLDVSIMATVELTYRHVVVPAH